MHIRVAVLVLSLVTAVIVPDIGRVMTLVLMQGLPPKGA
jgi:hypothetical protein